MNQIDQIDQIDQTIGTQVAPAPSRPVTREDTDRAFEQADNVLDVYSAMNQRCEEFTADENERGRAARSAGAMTPDTDVMWQGDVGVILCSARAATNLRKNAKPLNTGGSHVQVAIGEGVGSRHTVSTAEVSVFTTERPGPLEGPLVVADQPWTLSHPKHQNCEFEAGTYRIVYQRQFAEELRRAAD